MPLTRLQPETWSIAQACALTGKQTGNLSFCRPSVIQPTRPHQTGLSLILAHCLQGGTAESLLCALLWSCFKATGLRRQGPGTLDPEPLCWGRGDTALLQVPASSRCTLAWALMLPRGWVARIFAEPVVDDHHLPSCQVRSSCSTTQCPSPCKTLEHTLGSIGKSESPQLGQLYTYSADTLKQ